MFQINDTVISLDLIKKKFLCDLSKCKGICCVEGNAGAPLEKEEIPILEKLVPIVWDDLSEKAQKVIEQQGVFYYDYDGDEVTSIVDGEDCVFTYYDENGYCKCALEKAFREGRSDFYKPISCHLYPVRLTRYPTFTAVNYHRWSVCKAALELGEHKGVPMYQFLKEPLIRKFGEEWYEQLEYVANHLDEVDK